MARARRRPPAVPVLAGEPPVELAGRCVVEDWLSPAEVAELGADVALVRAANRWRDARRAWLDAHGVPQEVECRVIPLRAPTWRDGR